MPEPVQMPLVFDPASPSGTDQYRYELAGQTIEYTLRRSGRRRNISLTIDEHGLRVGAPTRASQRRIEEALNAHADWITRKLAVWRERRPAPFTWSAGAQLMLLGEPLTLAPDPVHATVVRHDLQLLLPAKAGDAKAIARMAIEWLRARAKEQFGLRVAHFAPRLGVDIPVIRLSNARTRWGTCHPHGRIHLNWRLIHMPPELLDYVVVHELAHLHEPNHSPRFWRHVERILPDHLLRRRRLRTDAYRFLLP